MMVFRRQALRNAADPQGYPREYVPDRLPPDYCSIILNADEKCGKPSVLWLLTDGRHLVGVYPVVALCDYHSQVFGKRYYQQVTYEEAVIYFVHRT